MADETPTEETSVVEEAPEVKEFQPKPKRGTKRKAGRPYEKAAQDYKRTSFPAVVISNPAVSRQTTKLNIVKFTNGYLTGVHAKGGVQVASVEMTHADAFAFERSLIMKYGSRLTRDQPPLPE